MSALTSIGSLRILIIIIENLYLGFAQVNAQVQGGATMGNLFTPDNLIARRPTIVSLDKTPNRLRLNNPCL